MGVMHFMRLLKQWKIELPLNKTALSFVLESNKDN